MHKNTTHFCMTMLKIISLFIQLKYMAKFLCEEEEVVFKLTHNPKGSSKISAILLMAETGWESHAQA